MKHTLFEIGEDALALEKLLDEFLTAADGEMSSEADTIFDDWLRENQEDLTAKLDGYGALIREWEAKATARKVEIERLKKLVAVDENKVSCAKERLKVFFELTGRTKEETARFKFSLVQNGGKLPLVIAPEVVPEIVPDEFTRKAFDNDRIRAELEAGGELDFARLGERGTSIRIR